MSTSASLFTGSLLAFFIYSSASFELKIARQNLPSVDLMGLP